MPSCASSPRRPACSGTVQREVGSVERAAPGGGTYVIRDFLVHVEAADAPVAGDDAADAAWFTPADLDALDTSPGLVEALEGWGILPRAEVPAPPGEAS